MDDGHISNIHYSCCQTNACVVMSVSDRVFGCHLSTLCQREGTTVPRFVQLCLDAVDKRGKAPKSQSVEEREALGSQWVTLGCWCFQVWKLMGFTESVEIWPPSRNCASLWIKVGPTCSDGHQPKASNKKQTGHYEMTLSLLVCPPPEEHLDLDHSQWEDVHVITGALKLFFRELPEPLFPFRSFQPLVEAISESHRKRCSQINTEML